MLFAERTRYRGRFARFLESLERLPQFMPSIGVLTLDIHVEHSHSLKEKRHVIKSLKDRLRERFNVAVAEIEGLDSWQYSVVAAVTISNDRVRAEQVLQAVEAFSAGHLGGALSGSNTEWI